MLEAIDLRTGPGRDILEAAALARVAEQLTAELGHIPAEEVVIALHAEYERFANSPVRDYIAVLVERSVRRRFAQSSDRSAQPLLR